MSKAAQARPSALSRSVIVDKHGRWLPPRPSSARPARSLASTVTFEDSTVMRPRSASGTRPAMVAPAAVQHKSESPDTWFQRVMRTKKLSPLDLADIFGSENAAGNPKVPLSHVYEVLIDLEPNSNRGVDPVTPEMEEFLYEHSYVEEGEVVVDIKEMLRALDIWNVSRTATSDRTKSPKITDKSSSRTVHLESKNRQLADLVSSLQTENLRLSQQLRASKSPTKLRDGNYDSRVSSQVAVIPSSPSRSHKALPTRGSNNSPTKTSKSLAAIASRDEKELVEIANTLQYSGVQQLEDLLEQTDKAKTGFVSLTQLRWLLFDHFQLQLSEMKLLETCLGMSFNAEAQLEYKELIGALSDLLIYGQPDMSASSKNASFTRFDKYLESGFPPGRAQARQLLEKLCRKYDLECDGCIAIAEIVRVFQRDLSEQHAARLPFPLSEQETVQLIQSCGVRPVDKETNAKGGSGFVHYDEVLEALFGGELDEEHGDKAVGRMQQAMTSKFWLRIRKTLCNGSRAKEASVLAQILKIFKKLDRKASHAVTPMFFKRIFDQHLRSEDIYVLVHALETTAGVQNGPRTLLRYDVFLFMTFGEPQIQFDCSPFAAAICAKLAKNERELRKKVADVMKSHGSEGQLGLEALCDLLTSSMQQDSLTIVELLFLYGCFSVEFETGMEVEVKSLWNFLVNQCWDHGIDSCTANTSTNRTPTLPAGECESGPYSRYKLLRTQIAECLDEHDLERTLGAHKQIQRGWVAMSKLAAELVVMLQSGSADLGCKSERDLAAELEGFIKTVSSRADKVASNRTEVAPFPGAIALNDFLDALMDWSDMARSMRLADNMAEINKYFELFDWEKNGTIQCNDWNKAWRHICTSRTGMPEWKIRVLQRRFPGSVSNKSPAKTSRSKSADRMSSSLWNEMINYSRLLVILTDLHQQRAREDLHSIVVNRLRRECESPSGELSTFRLERLFRELDTDGKGHFNSCDLIQYLSNPTHTDRSNVDDDGDESHIQSLLENPDAVAQVIRSLSGTTSGKASKQHRGKGSKSGVVTFDQFRDFVYTLSSLSKHREQRAGSDQHVIKRSNTRGAISSLQSLELAILDISREVSRAHGEILPLRAFRHFSLGSNEFGQARNPQSPVRSNYRTSQRKSELSSPIKSKHREVQATVTGPLTCTKLKQTMQQNHRLDVSPHLLGQFFQHIGSTSKEFLDLTDFARWAAPLSVDMETKVRNIVKKMIVKGKGGGGKVDLDRFLVQLQRRLLDSPLYASATLYNLDDEAPELPARVPTTLLLSRLHQLNIPLTRADMTALLRHFGMDETDEYVDFAFFLQRMYETSASLQAKASTG